MISSLIQPAEYSSPEAEDFFSSALSVISPDDVSVLHGDPGSSVTYKSKRYGDLEFQLTEPQTEDERKLFAQYLWNAGVLLAEYVSGTADEKHEKEFDVKGKIILELGAGTGLVGIVCTLAGAKEVAISDYPASALLSTIEANVRKNLTAQLALNVTVQGHEWGVISDEFSKAHAGEFTRILSADCLWMSGQHQCLVQSMLHFLSFDGQARVWVVAGFHTGRAKIAAFFEAGREAGLQAEKIWERDINGNEREWRTEQDSMIEDITERKKWLVIAILQRKDSLPFPNP